MQWGNAESAALRKEEAKGLRKQPISMEWDILLNDFKQLDLIPTPGTPA